MAVHRLIMILSGISGGSGSSHRDSNKNNKNKNGPSPRGPKEYFVRKYSTGISLAEQVIIGGRSMFLQIIDEKPRVTPQIDLVSKKGMKLIPNQVVGSASPVIEYEYNDLNEIEYFIDRASRMKIDDLYFLVKSIFKDVIATDEPELITLLATDTIMTFFQDQFVTTHYDVFTGPPGWGKGAILVSVKILGYRVVLAGDMSGPNLLDLLGPIEKCQVTLCEDEFDKIQDDPDKERIYKMGYEDIGSITRTVDPSSSDRKLLYYNPYCMKFFASEKGPDVKELGGFNDRLFRAEVKKGKPRFLIKEIKRQMERSPDKQLPKYRTIISRINFLRKVMVPLNISDRALELCGPAIRLFNCDKLAAPNRAALKEIMPMLSHFLRKKGQLDKKAIELVLCGVLIELFEQMDKEEIAPGTSTIMDVDSYTKQANDDIHGNKITRYIVSYDEICSRVMKEVEGNLITQRSFESPEYDRITHDSLLAKCRSLFEGKPHRISKGKNKKLKALSFDKDAVINAGKNFEVVSEIRILSEDEQEKSQPEDSADKSRWDEWTNGHGHDSSGHCNGRDNDGSGEDGTGGTKELILGHIGNVRDKGTEKVDADNGVNDSQDMNEEVKRTTTSDMNIKDIRNTGQTEELTTQSSSPNGIKLVPPFLLGQNDAQNEVKTAKTGGTNFVERGIERAWDLSTQEAASRFKDEVERLCKAAAARKANESGNGILGQPVNKQKQE